MSDSALDSCTFPASASSPGAFISPSLRWRPVPVDLGLPLSSSPLPLPLRSFYIVLPYLLPSLPQVPPSALDAEGTQCRTLCAVCLACVAYTASVLNNAFGRLGMRSERRCLGGEYSSILCFCG